MDWLLNNIVTLTIFTPVIGGLIVFLLPDDEKWIIRRVTFFLSMVPLALALTMWFIWVDQFRGDPTFQFVQKVEWFPLLGSSYHVGVDGISLPLILLSAVLTPLAILASFGIEEKVKMFMSLLLVMEGAMIGLFGALDLMIFFIFWEIGLVPIYFLIRIWGGKDKVYASFKFFIYTMAGSLGLLLSIQIMGLSTGTFDIPTLMTAWVNIDQSTLANTAGIFSITTLKWLAYAAFFVAFAIKVPIWPFHTWLPDAHTQAPTAGSMILAGVLLKLGAYGFIRLVIPLFPELASTTAFILAWLGALSIVLGGFAAFGQWDFKRLVAYSSVNHMGFVVLGIAMMAYVYGINLNNQVDGVLAADAIMATNGAVLQMINHGLSAAGMFFLVGVIYERTHTRDLKQYGGIWSVLPVYGGILIFTSMASLGLPGLNGFVGEFMITSSAWNIFYAQVALSMIGLLMTGAYILKGIGETLHGETKPEWVGLPKMTLTEHVVIWPLMIMMLALGIWPQLMLSVINDTVTRLFG
ncbi:MAG: NADH-quinone oxidoreductase subunit M [Ardenticatenaceae bacterium]|nr:NADH-quinone oxidoreductase subunit M [Ardenticatenaceae bacterium]